MSGPEQNAPLVAGLIGSVILAHHCSKMVKLSAGQHERSFRAAHLPNDRSTFRSKRAAARPTASPLLRHFSGEESHAGQTNRRVIRSYRRSRWHCRHLTGTAPTTQPFGSPRSRLRYWIASAMYSGRIASSAARSAIVRATFKILSYARALSPNRSIAVSNRRFPSSPT